jgi:Na+/H+-dicarboxylate symporter
MSSDVSPTLISRWFATPLWRRILLALVLGVIVGAIWGEGAQSIRWIGDLFIRAIQMVVVPLVFITIVAGIVSMGDPKRLGSLGIKTLALYMGTTLIAITIGLTLAASIQPGVGVDISSAVPGTLQPPISFRDQLMRIVPTNPVAALANGDFLAIIFFAILFGAGILSVGASGKPMADLMDSGVAVMLKLTGWVMEMAPFGVFALIAWVSGTQGVAALMDVIPLAATAILAFVTHFFLIYGGLMKFVLRLSPFRFFANAKNATLVAFSTSSSSATLPVTISVAEKNLGIKPVVASTVLPLGATINMDGSAIYVGVVSVFAAQAFGVDLTLVDYFIMAGATTLVSIGTAAVPGASVFLMAGVMATIGLSPAQIALVVGFVLPFDRPLDMMRTCLNVTGDLAVATAVAKWENEFDEQIFNSGHVFVHPEKTESKG